MADERTGRRPADSMPAEESSDGPPATGRRGRPRGPALVVAVAARRSPRLAVTLSLLLFPPLSINNDEPIYRLQAQALAAGHLFAPAPAPADSYTPWLGVVRDGHYVLKYTPVVPGVYALSLALTGTFAT